VFKEYRGIFKNLREMQDRLWNESMASFPAMASPQKMNQWQQETLHSVNQLVDQAVRHSLELQREWLMQWKERASGNKLKPELFSELSNEAMNMTQRWLENQNRLWNQWLEVLRASGGLKRQSGYEEWERAVQQSLEQQMDLLNTWSDMAAFDKLSSKEAAKLSAQMMKTMEKSIETQSRLWSQWISGLSAGAAPAEKAAKTAATGKAAKAETREKAADKPVAATAAASGDDLKQIAGIGPGLEKKLKEHGITTFRQLAELKEADIARLEEQVIRFSGRIKRDRWVEQAKKLVS
jgi:predicted flap endonuclease-1-like 5' DNA nuclease